MADDGVKRLLVTGDDDQLFRFHMTAALTLNGIERRGQTVIYTCMSGDFAWALEVGRQLDLTLEEIVTGEGEGYRLLCGDASKGWGARTGRVAV